MTSQAGVCLSLPEGGSKLVGSDQNQRERLIHFFYLNLLSDPELFGQIGAAAFRTIATRLFLGTTRASIRTKTAPD